ncbi:(2,3-dihydroxybenzoyl)adenylate synthase [Sphingomonas sp. RHCKR7]|uniref:(2,3-dihydroxybenzoyl)adenylate synthase n=1 Tax=Sphingomonas folli TaxID=2862497 RepID=UPI001CA5CC43|nr:(2,3-dihydroxybenzoyl)adenylate synthase [Sphingomonas folli]MBW6528624.1 (2,3-dihydroxybenzoyl)adenylate synthase [Sphingomonas folli]
MALDFTRWPIDLEHRYRDRGHWRGRPMTDIVRLSAAARPEAVAIHCGERRLSYAELDRRSERLALALYRLGLRRHDTALVQLPNVAEFYVVFFALLKIGVVPVNALFSHRRLELDHYARIVGPRLLIAARQHPLFATDEALATLRRDHPTLRHVLLLGDGGARDLAAACANNAADPAAIDVVGDDAGRLPTDAGPTAAGEVAFFQLSGGSTGTPKLIPRTHDDYYYSVRASAEICALDGDTRFLCALPASHNFPLSSPGALGVFHAGGTVVMAPGPEPQACLDLIQRHRVTMVALVPSALRLWLATARTRAAATQTLRLVQVGGAMLSETLARRVGAEWGCGLQQVFGMAEGLVSYTRLDDEEAVVVATQGTPISPDDEIRVVDDEGTDVPPGMPGHLLTRGPYTIRGYYRSPEHNAVAFDADGFYCSGDIVVRREDGRLQVVGRGKDQINRGGEKIAAEEIERLLIRHHAVREVALVAVPDAAMGEKSCAVIVPADGAVGAVTLRRYLREQGVADYKLPDRFEIADALPLTAIGKVDKRALRDRLAATPSDRISS